ncbi:MAG: hypothetical protein K9W45_11915 [Candidatus Heimdallarchaeum aukensis]|uniref:Uncharacterized protein n=1 Tax=Candidatus Heimdallarchaeum aukensis TaxID=2876573 RepID=A0A9Y1FLG0_9ARCH|nr:MAG: hypothetical protein K9W45_11915 [Candidatus Heimdallarchaeum aukensis]
MSTKTERSFAKEVGRAIIGALVLIVLLVIWLLWDKIYHVFYNDLFPNAPKGTLLIYWLLFLFPITFGGISLLIDGGYKAYKIAVPEKEEEEE